MDEVHTLKESFLKELNSARSLPDIRQLKIKYLGKKGMITSMLRNLTSIAPELRPEYGSRINDLKRLVSEEIEKKENILKTDEYKRLISSSTLDITLPGKFTPFGREHPVNKILSEIISIFVYMGFEVEEGPEVELDYYNFEALNIPKDHPARDMQDTFYISEEVVLRTHTSPVQIRVMENRRPPLNVIAPGKVYRCDSDISHTPMFHQVEGFMVDTDISFSHLKGVLESFIHSFFDLKTPVRFRPSYFPFTEPSAEVDIGCNFCSGNGCRVCKNTGWIEILGAGMINPHVFEMVGYDKNVYSGFAFGMGVERLVMLKFSIDDIRLFFENDLRFLRQF
ncbi:MAG: phenylalanine--tRNA ligase subunit alpha [Nitrospirae bacterium]|nr:phenylalanine--tRNA ligase subunit alpha [Nitrospirota bacterium]